MVIGLIAILMSGGAYCPFSPEEPKARINTCLTDYNIRCILVHPPTANGSSDGLDVTSLIPGYSLNEGGDKKRDLFSGESENPLLAVAVFTSGSTGTPKCVPLTHKNLITAFSGLKDRKIISGYDNVLQVTSVTFDIHLIEIIGALRLGACVTLLPPGAHRDLNFILHTIMTHQVSYWSSVPSVLTELVQYPFEKHKLVTLRILTSGGETLTSSIASKLLDILPESTTIWAEYGPAECSICTTVHAISKEDITIGAIPIGQPLPGYHCHILDEELQPVPPGHTGEMFIEGTGVFSGYLQRPDLTSSVLIANQRSGCVLYRTGDLVRMDPSSHVLYYVGRKDFQVKLRGQRVECGEIEYSLEHCSTAPIERAIVTKILHMGQEHLVAYVQQRGSMVENKTIQLLRAHCEKHLPLYMVPSFFVILREFPLNSNGKVNRKALPLPDFTQQYPNREIIVEPSTETEECILRLWKEILSVDVISVESNFFSLGGHSLFLMRLIRRYQKEFHFEHKNTVMADFYRAATIRDHARLVNKNRNSALKAKKLKTLPSHDVSIGPASSTQKRLFTDDAIRFSGTPGVSMYSTPVLMQVVGGISIDRLRRALDQVVTKQHILRTSLNVDGHTGELQQNIIDFQRNCYAFIETTVTSDEQFNALVDSEQGNKFLFDVSKGQVFRCHVIHRRQTGDVANTLQYTCKSLFDLSSDSLFSYDAFYCRAHLPKNADYIIINSYLAVDGESVNLFWNDLKTAYHCPEQPLEPLSLRYIDFATWESRALKNDKAEASIRYWQEQFDETTSATFLERLNYDRIPKDIIRSGRGHAISLYLTDVLSEKIYNLSRQLGITVNHLTLAAFFAFLFKITQDTDLHLVMPAANRDGDEAFAEIIGFFANIVPVRCQLDPIQSFIALITQIKSQSMSALAHSTIPYPEILRKTHVPPIRVMFTCNTPAYEDQLIVLDENTTLVPVGFKPDFLFDLTFKVQCSDTDNRLRCVINASADVYDTATIDDMVHRFEMVLSQLVNDPDKPLSNLCLLLPHELNLLSSFDARKELKTNSSLQQHSTMLIHEEFASRADEHPQKVAVALDDQVLSYAELLHASQYLALHLIEERGIRPGDIVAQCVEKSIEMVIGLIAILMSGGTYCPFPPEEPKARLDLYLAECRPMCTIAHSRTIDLFDSAINAYEVLSNAYTHQLISDNQLDVLSSGLSNISSLAVILFTSGSTGKPKAGCQTHANYYVQVSSVQQLGIFLSTDVVLQRTPVSFAMHLSDIISTMWIGGCLVIVRPGAHRDLNYILNLIERYQITYTFLVPSMWGVLVHDVTSTQKLRTLRMAVSAGEPLPCDIAQKVLARLPSHTKFFNSFGQMESTLIMTYYDVSNNNIQELNYHNVPTGRPFPGYSCILLDSERQPVAPGQVGELFIQSDAVFAGYLHQPALTDSVRVHIEGKGLCLRTGDLFRLDGSSQSLLYVGRRDFQVKLRGQRIESGEIEQVIISAPSGSFNRAHIMKVDHLGDEHLVAYVQQINEKDEQAAQTELREQCEQHLIAYKIPSVFVILREFPLNPNGKLDRKALPAPNFIQLTASKDTMVEPQTETESRILKLWSEVLELKTISVHSNFFLLGGSSLHLMLLVQQYESEFGISDKILAEVNFFQHTTICDHAQLVEKCQSLAGSSEQNGG